MAIIEIEQHMPKGEGEVSLTADISAALSPLEKLPFHHAETKIGGVLAQRSVGAWENMIILRGDPDILKKMLSYAPEAIENWQDRKAKGITENPNRVRS